MRRPVVITGLACVSSLGCSCERFTEGLLAGASGIRPITQFDVTSCRATHAGRLVGFDPTAYLPPMKLRRLDAVARLALACTRDALDDAGIERRPEGYDDVGVVLGSVSAGVHATGEYLESFWKGGPAAAPALLFSSTVGNAPASHCGLEYGLRGPNTTLMHKEASGLSAVVFAAHLVRRGKAGAVVAGGADDIDERFYKVHDWFGVMSPGHKISHRPAPAAAVAGAAAAEPDPAPLVSETAPASDSDSGSATAPVPDAVSPEPASVVGAVAAAEDPATAMSVAIAAAAAPTTAPFDAGRDGFVMGEGGYMLVLESEARAAARGATVLADLLGTGASSASVGVNEWPSDDEALVRCMRQALDDAGIAAEAIDLVYASANGTVALDRCEASALARVFGARGVPVSSIKGALGEFSAAGAASLAAAILCGRRGLVAPTLGLREIAADCPVSATGATAPLPGPTVLVNSFASGGTNFSLVVRLRLP